MNSNQGPSEKDELHLQTAKIEWRELERFWAQGKLIYVQSSIDLVDVALTLKEDDTQKFQQWISEGAVSGVSDEQAAMFSSDKPDFWAVVLAPWVLIQPIASKS